MKKLFKNQKGISTIQILVMGSALAGLSVISLKQLENSEAQQAHLNFSEQEKSVGNNVNDYLSSKQDCMKAFSAITWNPTNKSFNGFNPTSLNEHIKNSSGIDFDNIELNVGSLNYVSSQTLPLNETIYVIAELELSSERKNLQFKKLIARNSSPKTHNKRLPISFEFNGNSLATCYSQSSDNFEKIRRKENCEMLGGVLNGQSLCILTTKDFQTDSSGNLTEVSEQKYNFQDSLCFLQHNIARQSSTTDKNKLFSTYCPKVKYGGCKANGQLYVSKDTINISHGTMSNSATKDLISNLYDDGVKNRVQRLTKQFLITQDDQLAINTDNHSSGSKSIHHSSSISKYVVGAVIFGMPGLVIAKFMGSIFNCSSARKVYSNSTCMNGNIELNYVKTEKQKFKCKRWSCKCRWTSESTIRTPSEASLAYDIVNNSTPAFIDNDLEFEDVSSTTIEEEAKLELEALKNELATSATIKDLYTKIAQSKRLNDESAETPDEIAPSTDLEDSMSINLKDFIRQKEVSLWDNFTKEIEIDVSANSINTVLNYTNSKLSEINSLQLEIATPSETSDLAINKIELIEKSLISNITEKVAQSTTEAELNPLNPDGYKAQFSQVSPDEIAALQTIYNNKDSEIKGTVSQQ